MGWADLGIAQFNDMIANASMIASLNPSVPVIADADTGEYLLAQSVDSKPFYRRF